MYSQKLVRVAKRLSAIAAKEFPDVDECELRIVIAGALQQVTEEERILRALFPENVDDDLV